MKFDNKVIPFRCVFILIALVGGISTAEDNGVDILTYCLGETEHV